MAREREAARDAIAYQYTDLMDADAEALAIERATDPEWRSTLRIEVADEVADE